MLCFYPLRIERKHPRTEIGAHAATGELFQQVSAWDYRRHVLELEQKIVLKLLDELRARYSEGLRQREKPLNTV